MPISKKILFTSLFCSLSVATSVVAMRRPVTLSPGSEMRQIVRELRQYDLHILQDIYDPTERNSFYQPMRAFYQRFERLVKNPHFITTQNASQLEPLINHFFHTLCKSFENIIFAAIVDMRQFLLAYGQASRLNLVSIKDVMKFILNVNHLMQVSETRDGFQHMLEVFPHDGAKALSLDFKKQVILFWGILFKVANQRRTQSLLSGDSDALRRFLAQVKTLFVMQPYRTFFDSKMLLETEARFHGTSVTQYLTQHIFKLLFSSIVAYGHTVSQTNHNLLKDFLEDHGVIRVFKAYMGQMFTAAQQVFARPQIGAVSEPMASRVRRVPAQPRVQSQPSLHLRVVTQRSLPVHVDAVHNEICGKIDRQEVLRPDTPQHIANQMLAPDGEHVHEQIRLLQHMIRDVQVRDAHIDAQTERKLSDICIEIVNGVTPFGDVHKGLDLDEPQNFLITTEAFDLCLKVAHAVLDKTRDGTVIIQILDSIIRLFNFLMEQNVLAGYIRVNQDNAHNVESALSYMVEYIDFFAQHPDRFVVLIEKFILSFGKYAFISAINFLPPLVLTHISKRLLSLFVGILRNRDALFNSDYLVEYDSTDLFGFFEEGMVKIVSIIMTHLTDFLSKHHITPHDAFYVFEDHVSFLSYAPPDGIAFFHEYSDFSDDSSLADTQADVETAAGYEKKATKMFNFLSALFATDDLFAVRHISEKVRRFLGTLEVGYGFYDHLTTQQKSVFDRWHDKAMRGAESQTPPVRIPLRRAHGVQEHREHLSEHAQVLSRPSPESRRPPVGVVAHTPAVAQQTTVGATASRLLAYLEMKDYMRKALVQKGFGFLDIYKVQDFFQAFLRNDSRASSHVIDQIVIALGDPPASGISRAQASDIIDEKCRRAARIVGIQVSPQQ